MRRYKYTISLGLTVLAAVLLLLTGCDKRVYYVNCDAVREASAAPLRAGDEGYRSALDRNHDGTACEES
jgi:hypothetical protein